MTATMANVDAALKDDYQPAIRDQLVNSWMLLSQISSNSKDVEGREALLSLHVSRNSGVGARGASSALPEAGSQGYVNERVPVTRNYGSMAIEGDLIEASASDKGSFGRVLDRESKGVVTDLKNDVSRQLYGDASKAIAQAATTSASTTVNLTNGTRAQMRQFSVGMKVDIGTAANFTSVTAAAEIVGVDRDAATIELDTAVTTSTAHFISRAGSNGKELTGLREIVADTGTLFNVNPATTPVWKSTVLDAGGTARVPTELLFEQGIEDVQFESDEDINLIVTTQGVRRNFAAQYQGDRRYTNTVDIKAGFKAITVAAGNVEVPLVVDNDAPNGMAFLLNTSHLCQHQMGNPWSFMDRDGSVLHLKQGYDMYEAFIYNYHELTTDQRNAHAVIKDLEEA